jgi:hypothetical protein
MILFVVRAGKLLIFKCVESTASTAVTEIIADGCIGE